MGDAFDHGAIGEGLEGGDQVGGRGLVDQDHLGGGAERQALPDPVVADRLALELDESNLTAGDHGLGRHWTRFGKLGDAFFLWKLAFYAAALLVVVPRTRSVRFWGP